MKNKKRKSLKFLLFIIVIIILFYLISNYFPNIETNVFIPVSQAKNDNYQGIGQETITGKDGYFTTFTTIDNYKKTYIEYKQNGNSSWAQNEYWGGTMEENGCGITALSIILSGYGKNVTPEDLRKEYYPVLDGSKFGQVLKETYEIDNSDFLYNSTDFSKNTILNWLQTNRPILVCVWNQPHNNRWTTASHYLVLLACDDNNKVYVSNPNGGQKDEKSSGWYNINEITPYIAKILFIEDYI